MRITDADGLRPTCFATNTTGLRNLPLHDTVQNRIRVETVQLAWTGVLTEALAQGSKLS
ncbi:hypothetical protein ACFW2K_38115 [Streptomyces nigra]|uniref:hypothetical protein n=1 Tax=Streptomyces nigra TaxID=1827580 RepID=UPI003680E5B2